MNLVSLTRSTVTAFALLAAVAPSAGLAAPTGAQVLASYDAPGSDGYSIAEPRAAAIKDTMSVRIEASAPTNCSNAWQVFTDFEAMSSFLPGLDTSKVMSREAGRVVVMQRGHHRYGIIAKQYQSERELTLREPALIESRSLPGDELASASSTRFTPTGRGGCAIESSANIDLPPWVPESVAVGFIKSLAAVQMRAMLAEIKRRYPPASIPDHG